MFLKNRILMCPPLFYRVIYKINEKMEPENKEKRVSGELACKQWFNLYSALLKAGCQIHLMQQKQDFPDMVFTANSGLIHGKKIILSNFHFLERRGEKEFFEKEFARISKEFSYAFEIIKLPQDIIFEGQGEAIITNGKLIAGCGNPTKGKWFRTNPESIEHVAQILNLEPVILEMEDNWLYHLDTCFSLINPATALFAPHAFSKDSVKEIKKQFPHSIEVDFDEARNLVCNAIVVGPYLITSPIKKETKKELEKRAKKVIELDISEFLKAGGGCKCLTLQW